MATHETRPGARRTAARVVWHYVEMVIAMLLGMLLLGLVRDAALPEIIRFDAETLLMTVDMVIGMAIWMRIRRHSWPRIGEMSVAMVAPFVLLLLPYWAGAVSETVVTAAGHALMLVVMALVVWWRRADYTRHQHRLSVRPKLLWRTAVVLIALLPAAAVSVVNTLGKVADRYEARTDQVTVEPAPKAEHDPDQPTVAFLVAGNGANGADMLGAYEVLAGTGRVNTYVVAAQPGVVPLTGGLDVVPDLTFDGLSRLLGAQRDSLEAVVIPALQDPEPAEHAAINRWLRQQSAAGALTVSVCRGAQALADTGLLDGRPATSHWLRLPGLRDSYPQVKWVGGTRYVDDGSVITTAGVLSGLDGALRMVERLFDVDTAWEAARRVGWRYYVAGRSADIPEAGLELSDLGMAINASYETGPATIGVQLVDGTGELELASAFQPYTEQSLAATTVAVGDGPIRSRHGLTFVPRYTVAEAADDLDRLLVPGLTAARDRAAGSAPSAATGGLQPEYLHTEPGFPVDPVLRDMARSYDLPTARFAGRTMEYPVDDLDLKGSAWPWSASAVALLLVLLGAGVAVVGGRLFRRMRARARPPGETPRIAGCCDGSLHCLRRSEGVLHNTRSRLLAAPTHRTRTLCLV